jgi:hypothetical protein
VNKPIAGRARQGAGRKEPGSVSKKMKVKKGAKVPYGTCLGCGHALKAKHKGM